MKLYIVQTSKNESIAPKTVWTFASFEEANRHAMAYATSNGNVIRKSFFFTPEDNEDCIVTYQTVEVINNYLAPLVFYVWVSEIEIPDAEIQEAMSRQNL